MGHTFQQISLLFNLDNKLPNVSTGKQLTIDDPNSLLEPATTFTLSHKSCSLLAAILHTGMDHVTQFTKCFPNNKNWTRRARATRNQLGLA